jgi:hypothetical protein
MSIIHKGNDTYLRVDWSLGPSKTEAKQYYEHILNMLKETLQNSPMIIIILEYMRHIPLVGKYRIFTRPKGEDIILDSKGLNFVNLTFYIYDIDKYKKGSRFSDLGIEINLDNQYGIVNYKPFLEDFVRICYSKYPKVVDTPKELIIYLFSKHIGSYTPGIQFNYPYIIQCEDINKYSDKKTYHNYSIMFNVNKDTKALFNDKFDVDITELDTYITDYLPLMRSNYLFNNNYINNMYYMVNFSDKRHYINKGVKFLPNAFQQIINKNFPMFSTIECQNNRITIQSGKLYVIRENIDQDIKMEMKKVKIPVPEELDNMFICIKELEFKFDICKSSRKNMLDAVITISLIKNK